VWHSRRRRQLARRWADSHEAGSEPIGLGGVPVPRRRRHRAPTPRLAIDLRVAARHPRRLLALACLVGGAGAAIALADSDTFRIHGATVSGARRVSAETIYGLSGLEGRSIFRARTDQAEQRIEVLADVRNASVQVSLPNRAWIAIEEVQPLLVWESDAGALGVGADGRALTLAGPRPDLVHVEDEVGLLGGPGSALPIGLVDAALAFGARYPQLSYRSDSGFVLQVPEGWEARMGTSADEAERRLAILEAIRHELSGPAAAVAFADLRFLERPYYRLLADGASP
jgi:cell division septal protein FtsQ